MRMEVEREVSSAVSTVEVSMASEAAQKAAERLRNVEEERQHWITKRSEALARQEKLLKLLKLQAPKTSNFMQNEPKTTDEEGELAAMEEDKAAKATDAAQTRKKELKELQARAEEVRKKQQAAAIVLARNLKQLQAKRKREEAEVDEQPRKKVDAGNKETVETAVTAPEMHPFAAALDLDVGTVELANAACFRIATRHLAQTGKMMSKEKLQQAFKTYTGKVLDEVVDWSLLERSLVCLNGEARQNIPFSAATTRRRSVCWQPGRQFMKTPTFISTDSDRIQSLIEVEKEVVVAVCDTLSDNRIPVFIRRHRQRQFLAGLLDDGAEPTLSAFFSAFVGNNSAKSTAVNSPFPYRSHNQMAGALDKAEAWLSTQAEKSEQYSSMSPKLNGSRGYCEQFFSSKYAKPFSVTNDSVVRQLRRVALTSAGSKQIDPMKVLCHYELNGVCNDKNCSNYHQKDFEAVESEDNRGSNCDGDDNDDDSGVRVLKFDEMNQLLVSFAEFRGRIMSKWPVITSSRTSLKTEESHGRITAATYSTSERRGDRVPVTLGVKDKVERSEEDKDDYIVLDSREDLLQTGDARYFDDIDSRKTYGDMLQAKVDKDPSDTNAWLLFAIYQLQLEIELSDEAVNLSDDDRLLQQLLVLCKELNIRHHSCTSTSRLVAVDEANLKQCLHTLSRALEVEANAYCETLWLLYLHLSRHVTNKETEIDMVEQAVQFLPNSHALWLRYISTYEFESVGMAEGIYWRLLEHLAQVNSPEEVSNPRPSKERSILLTAISFHLCIKLWRAGATSRVLELMSALLKFGDTSVEFDWCNLVRGQLRSDELIAFCLAFAHVLIFDELPGLVEHWVSASSCDSIPVKGMTYSAEFLQHGGCYMDDVAIEKALLSYGLAFQIFEKQSAGVQDIGNVILTNWMLLLGLLDDRSTKGDTLNVFFQEKFDTIQQYPGASLTAAEMMALKSTGEQNQEQQLMLAMMNQSSETQFPEALHHYLFACRQSPNLVNPLDKTFPDVMERLAGLLDVDIDAVEKSIQDIMHDTSNISKTRALKALLDALLSAWMDQLALLLHQGPNQAKSLANIYVSLDICHLMGIFLDPSVAIDSIQMVLSSSNFGALSFEARQLTWMQRFVFQMDLLQRQVSDSLSWRDHQTRLTQLFRKYISEMSVEAEVVRQVLKEINNDGGKPNVADAVRACLYPERKKLITYNVNLELFRLCSAAVPVSEKASFYASFTDALALSSEFSLAFSDIATHEWELLAARAAMRKSLSGAKAQHPRILQTLVAVELRLRNLRAVSSLLQSELQTNPLLLEAWRLVMCLEILFGEKSDERSKKISKDVEQRQLVFACNTFGDGTMLDHKAISWIGNLQTESLTLRGLGLEYIPNAVLLKPKLKSLDVSGNELTELPMGLCQLTNLRELDASENALVEFPVCVNSLTQLKELRLAHNNMSTIPLPVLPHFRFMDIRWNTASHLSTSTLAALTSLDVLQAEENAIPVDELSKISDLLSSREMISSSGVEAQVSGCGLNDEQEKETRDKDMTEQPAHAKPSDNINVEQTEGTSAIATTKATNVADTELPSVTTKDVDTCGFATKDADGDQIMEQVHVGTPSNSTEQEGEQVMDTEVAVVDSGFPKRDLEKVVVRKNDESLVKAKSDGTDKTTTQGTVDESDSTGTNPAEQPKEIIDLDSSESSEENENEETFPVTAANTAIVLSIPATGAPSTDNIADAEDFVLNHSDAITATATRRESSHELATLVEKKLAAYMEANHIDSRSEVRKRNPTLWREFLGANVHVNPELSACRLCFAPNDGNNHRFNSTVLCMYCLEETLLVLNERNEQVEEAQEYV